MTLCFYLGLGFLLLLSLAMCAIVCASAIISARSNVNND